MTKYEYEEALRALLQTPDMGKWTGKTGPNLFSRFREGQKHPCATKCPNCNPKGSIKGDSTQSE